MTKILRVFPYYLIFSFFISFNFSQQNPPDPYSYYYPDSLGNGSSDGIIQSPGKGWAAYVSWQPDIFRSYDDLESKFETLISGGCNVLYLRPTWKEFTNDYAQLCIFMQNIQDFNSGKNLWEDKIKVIIRVMVTNTCNEDNSDYPYYISPDSLWQLCYNSSPCTSHTYYFCGQENDYQIRELKYTSSTARVVFLDYLSNISNFLEENGQNVIAIDSGFMGDWGENHLLMYVFYGNNDWNSFLSAYSLWFSDFICAVNQYNVIVFSCANNHWYFLSPSIANDMFSLMKSKGFTFRRDSPPEVDPIEFNSMFTNFVLSSSPSMIEWDQNDGLLNDFTLRYPNFSQLQMVHHDIDGWGLEPAISSLTDPDYLLFMNKLGYRLRINHVRYVVKQNLFINISNIGYGFCVNDIRLLLKVKQISTQNFIVLKTSTVTSSTIRTLRRGGVDCLDVGFAWPTRPVGTEPDFYISLQVKDKKTGTWVDVPWSNNNNGETLPSKNLKLIL